MDGIKPTEFQEGAFYMALPEGQEDWIVVQYMNGLFAKTNNTNKYAPHAFDKIHPKPVFEAMDSIKAKAVAMQTAAKGYYDQLQAQATRRAKLEDNDVVVDELLKAIGTVVDQLNGDLVLTGHDLENTNTTIVRLYTTLKDNGAV